MNDEAPSRPGYKVVFADCDIRVLRGGDSNLSEACAEACAYLRARIDGAGFDTPARLARLRLALMRISSADFDGDH